MKYDLFLVAAITILASCAVLFVVMHFVNKESKKHEREILADRDDVWAKSLASVERLNSKETEALNRYIISLKDLIVEKDERIKQLESDIATKDMIMACAKIDGSIDYDKLSEMAKTSKIHWSC